MRNRSQLGSHVVGLKLLVDIGTVYNGIRSKDDGNCTCDRSCSLKGLVIVIGVSLYLSVETHQKATDTVAFQV